MVRGLWRVRVEPLTHALPEAGMTATSLREGGEFILV
jgi:hypothetical protein